MQAQIKARLIEVARQRKTISYSKLAGEFGLDRRAPQLFTWLAEINDETIREKSVLLAAVVVHKIGDKMPGKKFFSEAPTRWGKAVDPNDKASCREFFMKELDLVHDAYSTAE